MQLMSSLMLRKWKAWQSLSILAHSVSVIPPPSKNVLVVSVLQLKPWDQIMTVLNLYHANFVVPFWNMDFDKDWMGKVASIPHAQSTSYPQHQMKRLHQQQQSFTPEWSGWYQRDSSRKTSWSLWSHSPTSNCQPSLSCPLHSHRCNRWSFCYTCLHRPSTRDLAETNYCRHRHHCCWCTLTGYRSSNVDTIRNSHKASHSMAMKDITTMYTIPFQYKPYINANFI